MSIFWKGCQKSVLQNVFHNFYYSIDVQKKIREPDTNEGLDK